MAHEVTGGHRKEGRARGGRTPMQLLAEAVETYEESALARWWEWEAASDGRRQLTWSTGRRDLRRLAGLGRDASDEEIADEEEDADTRLGLTAHTWDFLVATGGNCALLAAAEHGGVQAASAWLAARGLEWCRVESPSYREDNVCTQSEGRRPRDQKRVPRRDHRLFR
jgi:hypothetical protein